MAGKENRMFARAKFLGAAALLAGVMLAAPTVQAQTSQQVTIDGARKVLNDLRHDKAFGNATQLLREAKAIFIVPKLIKGGFIIGGEGGNGVMMARRHGGGWSDPAFYAIGAGSFGLQAGLEQSEMIMLIMTQKGLDGVLRDQFKVGAQAGISVVTLGSSVEGAIGGASPPDVVVWSSSTGLYGGLTVDGSVIRAEPNQDSAFYGRTLTSRDVLFGPINSPRAAPLVRELDRLR
jgi:SH3 domain-containing YSC84-like protein 1